MPEFARQTLEGLLLQPATVLCIACSGLLLMIGLLTGVWKFAQMWRSHRGLAHPYVDIAHRAALMYSFACIVMAVLAAFSVWSAKVNFYAALAALVYFVTAVFTYILQGLLSGPDNQLRRPHRFGQFPMSRAMLGAFMGSLIIAEIGGIGVLFAGFLAHPMVRGLAGF